MTEYVECQTYQTDGDQNRSQAYTRVGQDDPNTQLSRDETYETYGRRNQDENPYDPYTGNSDRTADPKNGHMSLFKKNKVCLLSILLGTFFFGFISGGLTVSFVKQHDCHCMSGFERASNDSCVDINECDTGDHKCSKNEKCINTIGNYECNAIQDQPSKK